MTEQLTAAEFFYLKAGWSYDPHKQTQDEGRQECARALAMAERWAGETGIEYRWSVDQDAMATEGLDGGVLWECVAIDDDYEQVASLGGIGFDSGEPWGDDYRRVIEAELALEAMGMERAASMVDFLAIRLEIVGAME